jgi:hypothetical protein
MLGSTTGSRQRRGAPASAAAGAAQGVGRTAGAESRQLSAVQLLHITAARHYTATAHSSYCTKQLLHSIATAQHSYYTLHCYCTVQLLHITATAQHSYSTAKLLLITATAQQSYICRIDDAGQTTQSSCIQPLL